MHGTCIQYVVHAFSRNHARRRSIARERVPTDRTVVDGTVCRPTRRHTPLSLSAVTATRRRTLDRNHADADPTRPERRRPNRPKLNAKKTGRFHSLVFLARQPRLCDSFHVPCSLTQWPPRLPTREARVPLQGRVRGVRASHEVHQRASSNSKQRREASRLGSSTVYAYAQPPRPSLPCATGSCMALAPAPLKAQQGHAPGDLLLERYSDDEYRV